jgi:hypothetical protein
VTSQADFDRFVESQRGVRRLVLRDLAAWWTEVEHLAPSEIKEQARTFLPLLSRTYGEVSAVAAADFYEEARASSVARGRFAAALAESSAPLTIRRRLNWMTDPLFDGDAASAFSRMSVTVDEAALQDGRNTVMMNAERDRARTRFARVPVGKTCAWCLMLASRGAVYRSAASAGAARQYHGGDCDCQPVPSWDGGKDLPPSYDEGHLYDLYDRGRTAARSGDPREIAKAIRRLDGGTHVNDGVAVSQ